MGSIIVKIELIDKTLNDDLGFMMKRHLENICINGN
jgi:hypothetical protein